MASPLVLDELWAVIAPLLPQERAKPKGGRPRVPDRPCLAGIIFVLRSGIPWPMLPRELGCGFGMACWRRLRDWQAAGLWERLQHELLNQLRDADQPELEPGLRRCLHGAGEKRGSHTGPNPTDRGKPGTKRHLVVDAQGIPLAELITPANVHETRLLGFLLDAIPPVRGQVGHPRQRPGKLYADKGYRSRRNQQLLRDRRIKSRIARPRIESSERLGKHRCVVEHTFAWLNQMRRLVIRYERRADIHEAFLRLGCCLVCFNFLTQFC